MNWIKEVGIELPDAPEKDEIPEMYSKRSKD
jgi:hypothetical protein